MKSSKGARIGFWITISIFSFMMAFTAYNELAASYVGQEFVRLGFPSHAFRVELSVAKVLGLLALLLPVPARVKEWAYAGFGINLVSAVIVHVVAGEGAAAYGWAVGFGVLLVLSYLFRLRIESSSPKTGRLERGSTVEPGARAA